MDRSTQAASVFNKRAELYQQKFMDVSMYEPSLDIFCQSLPNTEPSVLDVACGPGNITRYLLSVRPELHILGIDLAPDMIRLAKENNPGAAFQVLDAREIQLLPGSFDGIVSGFCFPYLSRKEVTEWIRNAASMLPEGGLLYMSTMEDEYQKSGLVRSSAGDELYMHFHEEQHLTQCLKDENLAIEFRDLLLYTNAKGEPVRDLILIGRKLK
ncbi:MAG TPA: class I SAM-dependent methyltransferase [Catalimonadaceae bacterium]|nr:class I SAM-dependent methyltransferase [Catalimonadaceae bacterium]